MAITKILKIDSASVGDPSTSLKRSIIYVMNPDKTDALKWTGGNAGSLPEECYNTMMITKEDFGKLTGRQGYHLIISFQPGETDELTAYNIAQEFGEEYFGDRYDYCFAVHNDHEHMHVHFIFNSIDRISGYKYRYENGDWAKAIQPITDRLCVRHAFLHIHSHDFRDDFTPFLHQETVTFTDVQLSHKVGIVEGGTSHGGAA